MLYMWHRLKSWSTGSRFNLIINQAPINCWLGKEKDLEIYYITWTMLMNIVVKCMHAHEDSNGMRCSAYHFLLMSGIFQIKHSLMSQRHWWHTSLRVLWRTRSIHVLALFTLTHTQLSYVQYTLVNHGVPFHFDWSDFIVCY